MPAGEPPPTSADSKPRPAYKVFVSSTYRDNEERRKLVQDAITTAGNRAIHPCATMVRAEPKVQQAALGPS